MWGAPYEAGFRVLDGLRAAVNYPELGLSSDASMAVWGYSGGGLASGWAAEAAATYAPELNIVGAVLGSPVVDPESVARRLNASPWAGLAALMIASLVHVFPEAKKVVDEHATEDGKALLAEIEGMSTGGAIRRFRNADIADYVDLSFQELFSLSATAACVRGDAARAKDTEHARATHPGRARQDRRRRRCGQAGPDLHPRRRRGQLPPRPPRRAPHAVSLRGSDEPMVAHRTTDQKRPAQ